VKTALLVHGLAGSSRWWDRTAAALAGRYDVDAVDLPRASLADAEAHVRERMGGGGVLVGHSLGGLIAARVAARSPALVERLVLVAPAGLAARTLLQNVVPLARTLVASPRPLLRRVVADAGRTGPTSLLRTARELVYADVGSELASITAPTLVVWGQNDVLVPSALAPMFEERIPGARAVVIPGAGHVPMVERPDDFERVLLEFLG